MRKITIDGRDYDLKFGLKGLFTFESITGHSYEGKSTFDTYVLEYSCLLAFNPDAFTMTFDKFIEVCDTDINIMDTFVDVLKERNSLENQKIVKKKGVEKG
jgi:hypothetical protein